MAITRLLLYAAKAAPAVYPQYPRCLGGAIAEHRKPGANSPLALPPSAEIWTVGSVAFSGPRLE